MNEMFVVFFSIILTENYSLTRFFSFINVNEEENDTKNLLAFGLTLTIILLLSVLLLWPINFILNKFNINFLYVFVSVLIILIVTRVVRVIIKNIFKSFYFLIRNSLTVITINSTLLGTILVSVDGNNGFIHSVISALAAGIGYTLAVMIFHGISSRIKEANIPKIFRGSPILFISAFIAAMAFEGFSGVLGIFFK